jgi:capsular exopolysaccharide synthesis family protein
VVERLVGLNRQLLEAENERKMAEASYRAALEPGAVDALAEGTIKEAAEAESKLAGLRQRRALLLVEATEEWPEVKEVDNQIAVLENQLKEVRRRAASTVMTNLGTRYRQAQAREQALRASFDRQRGETLTQNAAAINYRIMQQEIETNKNLLDGMLQRNKENEALFAGMRNNIHVSDYAIAPQVPVGPRRMLNTAVVFALSFGFGIGLSVFLGYMDNTVRSTDDVRKVLHLPTLASIPLVGAAGLSRRRRIPSALPERAGDGAHSPELLLNSDAPESLTEAYRQLRTSMLLSAQHGQLKSLLVTSSVPGEGKTTMAVNTAVSLARTGALVLLVDADLRKPRLHSLFGLDNKVGLSTVLSEAMEGADALKAVVHHPKSGLDVLTSGPILPSSAELLGTEQMRRLTAMLRSVYDYIVIDSPPVAPFADGRLLSSLVDGVVLVIDSRQNSREVVLHSYGLLQSAGANICGVALNKFTGQQYDYKHYYREQ